MGWLKKIFKGSSHGVTEGRYRWNERYNEHVNTRENEPSSPGEPWSEVEDIDHAIALSLAEEEHKRIGFVENESQLNEDEQLAKALQESLNADSPPRHGNRNGITNMSGNGNIYHPIPFPYSTGFRICAGCNSEIGHGRFLNCMGAVWHPECFRCHACHQPICDYEFSMSGNYPYHKTCYKEHYHPKCDVCKHFIPTNATGLIEYRAHPFWVQKYCPIHEHDGTPRCCSCERMEAEALSLMNPDVLYSQTVQLICLIAEAKQAIGVKIATSHKRKMTCCKMQPRETKYVALEDGRKLCLECLDSAIMDTNECQPLYLEIQEFYRSLNMEVEQQVPLLLVERQALNVAMDGEKSGHHHMPETRGLCLSEGQTVSTILRRPRIGAGNKVTNMITEPYTLIRRCEVTAILILYGLPRLLTGSILAHEMMHAWLRLQGYRTLSQDVEEGICQVLAHLWLQSQIMPAHNYNIASTSSSAVTRSSKHGSTSPFEMKLGEFFKHQIEADISPVYGNGFRAGNQAVLKYGLPRTLEHIRMTGTFPF